MAGNGTLGYSGDGGAATSAQLYGPQGVAVDGAGNLYIADSNSHVIRKVTASTGIITTVAGNGTLGYSGDGGAATSAQLRGPDGVAVDGAGNLYIADTGNKRIRKVDTSGTITTVAGNGTPGYTGDGGAATAAELNSPYTVAVDGAGNLYIADSGNNRIRKVTASTGIIITVAGNGTAGYAGDGGVATSAELNSPYGVTVAADGSGNLYISDSGNNRIRVVDPLSENITTVAGNGTSGYAGDGGVATSAEMIYPGALAVDNQGNLYIEDGNNVIRKVTASTGIIATVAGNGSYGYTGDGGPATSAELNGASGLAVDSEGNQFIADPYNRVIRKVSVSMVGESEEFPSTPVGSSSPLINALVEMTANESISSITAAASQGGIHEYVIGTVTGCTVDGVTSNTAGTICTVPFTFQPAYPGRRNVPLTIATDTGTYSVGLSGVGTAPQVAFTPGTITTVAGNGSEGYAGDGGAATSAELNYPWSIAVDNAGNIYIADQVNNVIRKMTASTGIISTVAGNGSQGYAGDGGAATSAELNNPDGIAVDGAGNIYIADMSNMRIRMIDASGTITTVAGNGSPGYMGDGGTATSAELYYPGGVAVDNAGNLYFADSGNSVIRKVTASTGIITTVAGNGIIGYTGDGSAATSAELNSPYSVVVDNGGDLYFADSGNSVIRKVAASTGIITTVAGNGSQGDSGDGGVATSAELNYPYSAVMDNAGNIYIADQVNNVIRKVTALTGIISTVAGNGSPGYLGDGGTATSAKLNGPQGVVLDGVGNIYFTDTYNNRIRKVTVGTVPTINFATATNISQTDTTDEPATVVVSNTGNMPLTFSIPTTGNNPSYPANFPVNTSDSNLCSSVDAPLAAGGNCDLSALFQPTGAGANVGSAILTDNSLNQTSAGVGSATQSISLSGTGVDVTPTCTWPTASSITFGQQLSSSTLSGGSCTLSGTSVAGTFSWQSPTTTPEAGANSEYAIFTPSDTTVYLTATGSIDVSVAPAAASIATVTTLDPSTYGQSVTLTFTISGISGGPTPTGSLTLTANGSSLGTVNLASGVAIYTSGALPAGIDTIVATYSGDLNYR